MGDALMDHSLERRTSLPPREEEVEDLPLKVAPDWDQQVTHADELCRLVDRHLNGEARGRELRDVADFRPQHLCPEQRVQMITDVVAVVA